MKRPSWMLLAALLATAGCGGDDAVSPSADLASAWVGEYSGTGSYALSNGQSGVEQPTTLVIAAVNPKQISVAATLVYGSRSTEQATAFALLTPRDVDQLKAEYRNGTSRIVLTLVKEEGAISGSIITSSLRINGTWSEDQRMNIKVAR